METNLIGQFISMLFASRTQAHIFHLQTPSYAAHKALNEYYDGIIGLTDGLAEAYQGKYGIISGYTNVSLQEYSTDKEIIVYFISLEDYVSKSREMIPQDSYLQNTVDEIISLLNATIYKLRYLK